MTVNTFIIVFRHDGPFYIEVETCLLKEEFIIYTLGPRNQHDA
jgi:hypothetical protein